MDKRIIVRVRGSIGDFSTIHSPPAIAARRMVASTRNSMGRGYSASGECEWIRRPGAEYPHENVQKPNYDENYDHYPDDFRDRRIHGYLLNDP